MRYTATKDIYRHWLKLKGRRLAPDRQELNPADLGAHLGNIILLERIDGEVRFRIAGTRACVLFGQELRGHRFLDVFSHFSAEDAAEVLMAVEEDSLPVIIGVSAHFPDRFSIEGEIVLLPFTHDKGKTGETRILGAISTRGYRPAALPPCSELEILSFRVVAEQDSHRLQPGMATGPGPAEGGCGGGAT